MKKKIEEILKSKQISYELIPLPEDLPLDVQSHMKFHGHPMSFAMPNMIFKTEKGLIVVQKRGDSEIDNKKLKKALGIQRLSFASKEDLETLSLEPGIVPPLGYDLPFYMDKKVLDQDEIYTGTGDRLFALKINPKDLEKLNNATLGDFTLDLDGLKKKVYSGIRATGRLHLGNYFGAVKGMLELQDKYDCVFSVVDLHAITTPYDPKTLKQNVREVLLDFLAVGLDPENCLIEIQSLVPEHTELSFLLSTIYPVSRLEDLPTYKDKKAQFPKYVNMGLLYYPVLMAADILLYKAELVPVGRDQEPHLEVTREIARKFNQMFGQTFPEPQRFKTTGEYVPSLLGEGKMGKSHEGSYINLTDDLSTIKQRLAAVPTDSGILGGEVPNTGGVATLFSLLQLFDRQDLYTKYAQDYSERKIRYSEMKEELAEIIYKELEPIQKRRTEIESSFDLDGMIEKHTAICREAASQTLKEAKEKMGLL